VLTSVQTWMAWRGKRGAVMSRRGGVQRGLLRHGEVPRASVLGSQGRRHGCCVSEGRAGRFQFSRSWALGEQKWRALAGHGWRAVCSVGRGRGAIVGLVGRRVG
jgi:hypothetical protein